MSPRRATSIERALADERRLNAERLRAVQAHMKELAGTIRDLRAGFQRVEAEKAELVRELEAREAEIVELRNHAVARPSDTQTMHEDGFAETSARIESLEAQLREAEQQAEELRGTTARAEQRRRDAETRQVEAQQRVAELETRSATQEAEIERLRLAVQEARRTALAAAALIPPTVDPESATSHTAGPLDEPEMEVVAAVERATVADEQPAAPVHEWWLEPGVASRGKRSLLERAERVARGVASDATIDDLRSLDLSGDEEDDDEFLPVCEADDGGASTPEPAARKREPAAPEPGPRVAARTPRRSTQGVAEVPDRPLPAAAALLASRPAPEGEDQQDAPLAAAAPAEPQPVPQAPPPFHHPDVPELDFETQLAPGALGPRYQARDVDTRRPVTVQLLPGQFAEVDGKRVDSLILARHSNLVAALSFGVCREGPYLVFERAHGETIGQWIGRVGRVPEHVALMVALQVARGLRQAAFHGALHGDLQPERVRIAADGEVRVEGAGLRELAPERAAPPNVGFTAPERLRGGDTIDVPGDAFSFAALVYFMLTARPPFEGDRETVLKLHATRGFPDVRDARQDVSDATVALLARLSHADPDRRPVSWDQILVEVERLCPTRDDGGESAVEAEKGRLARAMADHPYLFAIAASIPLFAAAAAVHLLLD